MQMKNKSGILIAALVMFVMIGVICMLSVGRAAKGGYYFQIFDFSFGKAELRNTIELSPAEVNSLKLEYGSKNIFVYSTSDEMIVIKEFLCNDRPENMASVTYGENNEVVVTGGNVHTIAFFSFGITTGERIEVYIPDKALSELSVQSGSGNITGEHGGVTPEGSISITAGSGNVKWNSVNAEAVSFQAGSGNINLSDIEGDIRVQTGSGNISGDYLNGNVNASAGSGNITLTKFAGGGTMTANSGNLKVETSQVDSDIRMKTGSGNIKLEVPKDLQFRLEINTGSGNIHTDFDGVLTFNKKGNSAKGNVGDNPDINISLEANSGNVKVSG